MTDPQKTPQDQARFDTLCAGVDDYEPLPTVAPGQADVTPEPSGPGDDSFNEEILAGLVSP